MKLEGKETLFENVNEDEGRKKSERRFPQLP